jgi:PAT family beta-lactamase induction signal transducer AmpG
MKRTGSKLAFFAVLYFLQGAVFAYAVNFQKPFLAANGISKDGLGFLSSLLLLPFIFKIGLGALSDRFPLGPWGSRKPYMAIGLSTFALCYFLVSTVQPGGQFTLFVVFSFLASVGLALFDTCADGWAVDIATASEQSAIQGAMVAGRSLGLVTMSIGFGWIAQAYGFSTVFQMLGLMALGVLILVLSVRYQSQSHAQTPKSGGHQWGDLLTVSYGFFALYGILYSMVSFGTDGLLTLHLTEVHHLSSEQIGTFGLYRGLGALVGAGSFGVLAARIPLKRSLVSALVMLGLGALLPLVEMDRYLAGGLWGFSWGFQETAFVTLAMSFARGPWAATFFALSMIFSNIGTALGEALAAPLAGRLGFEAVFLGFSMITVLVLPIVFKLSARGN